MIWYTWRRWWLSWLSWDQKKFPADYIKPENDDDNDDDDNDDVEEFSGMRLNVAKINYEGAHDHFRYTGKYRGPMHSTLRYKMPK